MTDPVLQGRTMTNREEICYALDELRLEVEQLSGELDIEQDPDKRIRLQTQLEGKQDVVLLLELELDMAAETA